MAIESASDRLGFLDEDEFGSIATIGGSPVNGIFDNAFSGVIGVEDTNPVFLCRTADVSAITRASTFVHNSINYNIVGIQEDGTGMTNIELEAQ